MRQLGELNDLIQRHRLCEIARQRSIALCQHYFREPRRDSDVPTASQIHLSSFLTNMNHSRPTSSERYFITYWWVFTALGSIAIAMSSLFYLEQDTGRQFVDWCTLTCAMFGALIGALLIVLTLSHQKRQDVEGSTIAHLNQLDTRVHILECTDEPDHKARSASRVFFLRDFKPKNGSKD